MTSLEMAIRLLISRLERRLWDDATATDIPAPNGDIIGSAVKGYHRVNNGFVKYTLKDYERGVTIDSSFAVMIMDGDRLALFIKMTFQSSEAASIHELEIASITINGNIISLDDIDSDDRNSRSAENMIMSLIINNL
jgi:hypothetical protein